MAFIVKSINIKRKQHMTILIIATLWVFFLPLQAGVGHAQGFILSIDSPAQGSSVSGQVTVIITADSGTPVTVQILDLTGNQKAISPDASAEDNLWEITFAVSS